MARQRGGLEAHVVAAVAGAAAEILVLAIQEESFVPAAELFEYRAPDEQAGSRDPVGTAGTLVVGGVADELARPGRAPEEPVEEERVRVGRAQRREPALREVERAVFVDYARRRDGDAGLALQQGDERLERGGLDPSIRVQKEHVRARCGPPPRVAAGGKATVGGQLDRPHVETGDGVERAVARGVVDHHDVYAL